MTDPVDSNDPEADLRNAATAETIRSLLRNIPPAHIGLEERATAIRSAVNHAWADTGAPPHGGESKTSQHSGNPVTKTRDHQTHDHGGSHQPLPPLIDEAPHGHTVDPHDGDIHPHHS